MQDWYTPEIEVEIKDTHSDTGLCGQIGVVRGVNPGMCAVFLPDEARTVNIAPEHLRPVTPERGDKGPIIYDVCTSFELFRPPSPYHCFTLTQLISILNTFWVSPSQTCGRHI